MAVVFGEFRKGGRVDLEAVEMLVRDSMHQAGACAVEQLLKLPREHAAQSACRCGHGASYHDRRSKQIVTVLGAVSLERAYYVCSHCGEGHAPWDRELDVEGTQYSPGVRRMMAVVGSDSSFQQGREQLELLAGVKVTTKAVERQCEAIGDEVAAQDQTKIQRAVQLQLPEILASDVKVLYIEMDGTQVPVVRKELEGRRGRVEGQRPRTREMKLGCVFTQTATDEEGRPIRDEDATTYVGAIENAEPFGRRIYVEAFERGWSRAQTKVVLGDGADWIWNIAAQHFPGAIEIVDLYHARQHLWNVARLLYPNAEPEQRRWVLRHQHKLEEGRIDQLVELLRSIRSDDPEVCKKLQTEANYFEGNAARMQYPKFRRLHLFVGSGVIEAGCKTLIGARLKHSGMFWTIRAANAIVALRCSRFSRKFEDYWTARSRKVA